MISKSLMAKVFQNYAGRVRYWTCCGTIEKCSGTARNGNDKRRICEKCCEKWSLSVHAKLGKYDKDGTSK